MDPKQKLIAVSVGAVCGLIIVALAVLLVMQIGAMNAAREARDSLEASINSHYAEKPYPSKANREIRKQDAEAYTAWSDRAHLAFTHGLQVPQGESSSQFVSRIGEDLPFFCADRRVNFYISGRFQTTENLIQKEGVLFRHFRLSKQHRPLIRIAKKRTPYLSGAPHFQIILFQYFQFVFFSHGCPLSTPVLTLSNL